MSEQTYYRWRWEYGGMKLSQCEACQGVREGEPTAEAGGSRALKLDKLSLKEASEGNF